METKDSDIFIGEELQKETCFIINITQEDGQVFIHADYIQRLDGNEAIEEAKKRGDADTSIIDGKIKIAVVNDYYTINDNPKIRKLPLDSSAIFELLYNPDAGKLESNLSGLKKIYKDAIFTLTIKNGRVIKVFEIFVP